MCFNTNREKYSNFLLAFSLNSHTFTHMLSIFTEYTVCYVTVHQVKVHHDL